MVESTRESPQRYARIAGVLYLVIIVAGICGELFVRGAMVVPGNAAATLAHIAAAPQLWRLGIAGDLLMHLCDIPVMWALYLLLRPVDRRLALFALLANLVQTAVLVVNKVLLVVPLLLLTDAHSEPVMDGALRATLAYAAIQLHDHGFAFGLLFFGVACLVEGGLIRRSGFLPKTLGVLMQLAGACYLINSFALVLSPPLAHVLFPAILLPAFVAELSLALWLTIRGVDVVAWWRKREAMT